MMTGSERVDRLASCTLVVADRPWTYAIEREAEIEAHWQRRCAENPSFFNGSIRLMCAARQENAAFRGEFLRTDFKSYLFWREQGFPEAGVLDGFGSALIRSSEGHIVLGRQRAGNVNAGLAYLPGGFIDASDIATDGVIDINGSILRELAEETGLRLADVEVRPGYLMTTCGALRSFAREVVSPLPAGELGERIRSHIASDPEPELADVVIVRSHADLETVALAPYARVLLGELLA